MKARLSFIVIKEYLFTLDHDRRRLFFFLVKLIRQKKLAIDKGMGFMLSMLGYHRHILLHKKNIELYRSMVAAQDKGSWKQMIENE
jgi:hypothetical protein